MPSNELEAHARPTIECIGGWAALVNPFVSLATLGVAVGLIGIDAMVDNQKLIAIALERPAPLIIQDGLKVAMAALTFCIMLALHGRLKHAAPRMMSIATGLGGLAIVCLLVNAGLSLYAVSQAARWAQTSSESGLSLHGLLGVMGFAVIFLQGWWYLLVSWSALKTGRFPTRWCYLGLAMGGISLIPPLGILVLMLGIAWSLWLGKILLGHNPGGESGVG